MPGEHCPVDCDIVALDEHASTIFRRQQGSLVPQVACSSHIRERNGSVNKISTWLTLLFDIKVSVASPFSVCNDLESVIQFSVL